jgi:hypothetical protein
MKEEISTLACELVRLTVKLGTIAAKLEKLAKAQPAGH